MKLPRLDVAAPGRKRGRPPTYGGPALPDRDFSSSHVRDDAGCETIEAPCPVHGKRRVAHFGAGRRSYLCCGRAA